MSLLLTRTGLIRHLIRYYGWCLVMVLLCAGCNTVQSLRGGETFSPREQYARRLEKNGLLETSMVRAWLESGDPESHDSIWVSLPFQETGYFPSSEPQARFYQLSVKEGQVLTVTCVLKSSRPVTLFADLFIEDNNAWKITNHADSTLRLSHEFEETGNCLVRIQPELLASAYYSISLSVTPVLMNPVKGATNKSIGSFYGDSRDGGKRKHEGVDIFAPKGTPVVAPTAGIVTRVTTSGLGGKVVWMNDVKRRHSYYFAHLDSQWVKAGRRVKQGDTLGTVGNTGNARTTPSHLHFGVYQRTSIDPIAYIRTMERLVNEVPPDTLFQAIVFRVNARATDLRLAPDGKAHVMQSLAKDTYVNVVGQTKDWYRVMTADKTEGFVEKRKVAAAEKGKPLKIETTWLVEQASEQATPIELLEAQVVERLASFGGYRYVKTKRGAVGWVLN